MPIKNCKLVSQPPKAERIAAPAAENTVSTEICIDFADKAQSLHCTLPTSKQKGRPVMGRPGIFIKNPKLVCSWIRDLGTNRQLFAFNARSCSSILSLGFLVPTSAHAPLQTLLRLRLVCVPVYSRLSTWLRTSAWISRIASSSGLFMSRLVHHRGIEPLLTG